MTDLPDTLRPHHDGAAKAPGLPGGVIGHDVPEGIVLLKPEDEGAWIQSDTFVDVENEQ